MQTNEGELDGSEDCCEPLQDDVPRSSKEIPEQERFLPIANISRIMKRVLPPEAKLSKEAKECVQECITEFILFITSEASERCAIEKRKTISGEDLLLAFSTLGFDEYLEPLEEFLKKYREANKLQSTQMTTSIINMNNPGSEDPEGAEGGSAVIYLQEQQLVTTSNAQPQQVFYDAANGQYLIPVQDGSGGTSLWQIVAANGNNPEEQDNNPG